MKRKDMTLTLNISDRAADAIAREAEKRSTYGAGIMRLFLADLFNREGLNVSCVDPAITRITGKKTKTVSGTLATNFSNDQVIKLLRGLYEKRKAELEKGGHKGYYSLQKYIREELCRYLQEQGHDLQPEDMFDSKRENAPA